jgi:DNA replication protein DnaC
MTISEQSSEIPECPFLDLICICGNIIKPYYTKGYTFNQIGKFVTTKEGEWHPAGLVCDKCLQEEDKKRKIEEFNKKIEATFIRRGLSPINKKMTFDTFKVNDNNKKIYDYIFEYKDKIENNIFLTGKCGNGKTHLASALAIYLFEKEKYFQFVVTPELLMQIRNTFKRDSEISELDIIEKYTDTDFLILDDFGAEKVSEWTLETIFLLLDTRIRNMKPFFITSNLTISEIGKIFNDRIASRIAGECEILELEDEDNRIKFK